MKKQPSAFISYSHSDRDRIIPIASYLGRLGVRVWIDTKELSAGQSIVEQVSKAIASSDLYIIAISPSALASSWVNHELNTALSLEINQGHPKVLPIIVAKADIPPTIQSRLYIDMTNTLDAGKASLRKAVKKYLPGFETEEKELPKDEETELILTSVVLQLCSETKKYFGGVFGNEYTKQEVEDEAIQSLKILRRKANGILLNFLSASEMNFNCTRPKFPNGELSETTRDSSGAFDGTFTKEAVVDVEIVNPDEKKLNQLVSSKLESLGVAKAIYSFVVSPPIEGLPQQALERLQNEYILLGWDPDDGADVELSDDLKLSVACTEERIRVGIATKYRFEFERRAKEFSVREFVSWIIGIEKK